MTASQDAGTVSNKSKLLSWEGFLTRLAGSFGITRSQMDLVWHGPTLGEESHKDKLSPHNKDVGLWIEALYRQSSFPGESFHNFSGPILRHLDASLHWKVLDTHYASGSEPVASMDFCADILVTEVTKALYGRPVYDIQPDLTQQLYDFSEEAWKIVMFEYCKIAARRAANAKDSIIATMRKHIQSPEELF